MNEFEKIEKMERRIVRKAREDAVMRVLAHQPEGVHLTMKRISHLVHHGEHRRPSIFRGGELDVKNTMRRLERKGMVTYVMVGRGCFLKKAYQAALDWGSES